MDGDKRTSTSHNKLMKSLSDRHSYCCSPCGWVGGGGDLDGGIYRLGPVCGGESQPPAAGPVTVQLQIRGGGAAVTAAVTAVTVTVTDGPQPIRMQTWSSL